MNVAHPGATDESDPEPADSRILEVRDLRIDFGGVHAVNGASFGVPRGVVTGLIGPNGAGKSTALKLIVGALHPTGGAVILDGQDITGWPPDKIARHGVIRTFQHSSEFPRLTVMENLLVAAPDQRGVTFLGSLGGKRSWRANQTEIVDRARELLAEFQMHHAIDEYAGRLSGGQKRLVEIMRALMAQPKLLLLDEPLAGVNPTLRLTIERHLLRLRETGLTMVMIEHELATIERCCDSVIVMAQGRVLAEGTMGELREHPEVIDAYLAG
jgi:neutral amino acid transport system ATP-binding protein